MTLKERGPAPEIVVMGDVITDIIVRPQESLARASDTRASIETRPGGSAANQAAWLASLGLKVHLIGRVGRDAFGLYHRQEFERLGVIAHLAEDPERPTGTIVVLVEPDGERNMLTDRGANLALAREDVPARIFKPGSHFHLSGYSLFDPRTRPAAFQALELARQNNMSFSVDPASTTFLKSAGLQDFLDWTRGAALIFPNLEEGQLLTGKHEPGEIIQILAECYGEVVLKLGGAGATWGRKGVAPVFQAAHPAPVVDSTGAGDAFCAGFLSEWLSGARPEKALEAGVRAGALAVAKVGARPS